MPIEKLRDDDTADFFEEVFSGTSTTPRPTGYQVTSVTRAKKGTYHAAVTLNFPIGPETRLYEVDVSDPDKCFIKTLASDDVSGTESYRISPIRYRSSRVAQWKPTTGRTTAGFRAR